MALCEGIDPEKSSISYLNIDLHIKDFKLDDFTLVKTRVKSYDVVNTNPLHLIHFEGLDM